MAQQDVAGLRQQILDEIKRVAKQNDDRPPGVQAFTRETGITEGRWRGVIWARWSDALKDAGFAPNEFQTRYESGVVLDSIIRACRHYGRLPTTAELRLRRRADPSIPANATLAHHFPTRTALVAALAKRAAEDETCRDLSAMLPEISPEPSVTATASPAREGLVYLIKSGEHYKIGRSDELERRVKEIRIALPEAASLVHTIRTDDPSGIENYWHRRFAERRANGEWFRLSPADVAAFRRRKFQ